MKTKIIVTFLVALYLGAAAWAGFCQDPAIVFEHASGEHVPGKDASGKDASAENRDSCTSLQVGLPDFQLQLLLPEAPQLRAKKVGMDSLTRKAPTRYGNLSLTGEGLDPSIHLRTDQISQFILRFNGDSAAMAALADKFDFTARGSRSLREGHVLSLINATDVLSDETLAAFAEDVCNHRLYMDEQQGSDCLAVATLGFKDARGEVFPVRILLRRSEVNGAPVWYMKGVDSPYFTNGRSEPYFTNGRSEPYFTNGSSDAPYYIDLMERDVNFMGLSSHTDRSAASLAGPDFRSDNLSVFLFLYRKGIIRYDHAESPLFFFSLGAYAFRVESVESFEHKRSGYLITRIVKDGRVIFENVPV